MLSVCVRVGQLDSAERCWALWNVVSSPLPPMQLGEAHPSLSSRPSIAGVGVVGRLAQRRGRRRSSSACTSSWTPSPLLGRRWGPIDGWDGWEREGGGWTSVNAAGMLPFGWPLFFCWPCFLTLLPRFPLIAKQETPTLLANKGISSTDKASFDGSAGAAGHKGAWHSAQRAFEAFKLGTPPTPTQVRGCNRCRDTLRCSRDGGRPARECGPLSGS